MSRRPGADSESDRQAVAPALALALLLAIAAQGGWYAAGFYGISWDDAGRCLDAARWRHESALLSPSVWLPFHRVVVGSALAVYPDLFITPRVVAFLFGLAALGLVTWLAAELFPRDARVAVTTALLAALFPPRVVLALAPLTSLPFTCAILAAMIAVARWLATPTRANLLFAALGFAVATTIRYEGWVFAATFGGLVVVCWWRGRLSIADVVASGAIVSAFPLLWLGLHAAQNGDPLAFLDLASARYDDWAIVARKNPLTEFLVLNAVTLNLIGLYAAVTRARSDSRMRAFLLLAATPLLLVALALFVGKRAQSGPSWRMIDTWSLLLLPFTADVATAAARRLSPRRWRPVLAGALVALSLVYVGITYRLWRDSRWAIPELQRTIGRDLNGWLVAHPGGRVLIEASRYDYLNVLVSSQQPEAFVPNSPPQRPRDPSALIADDRPVPWPELQRRSIRLLVFRSPDVRARLERESGVTRLRDYGDWAVYETR